MTVVVNDPGNDTGYALTCPECLNPNARSLPCITHEAGDEYSIVAYSHVVRCPTCDA